MTETIEYTLNKNEETVGFKDLTDQELEKLDNAVADEFERREKQTIWTKISMGTLYFGDAITLIFASAFIIGGMIAIIIYSPVNNIEPNIFYMIVAIGVFWVSWISLLKNIWPRKIYDYLFPKVQAWVKKKLKKK